eukprot:14344430-Alexandrium_andersonii.AAC.1
MCIRDRGSPEGKLAQGSRMCGQAARARQRAQEPGGQADRTRPSSNAHVRTRGHRRGSARESPEGLQVRSGACAER